jgi:hypothetical protein
VIRKYYSLSIGALLLIPVTSILGVRLFTLIDPELAAGHPDYVRHYAQLEHLRGGVWWFTLLTMGLLWLLCCAWVLRARARSLFWLWLALLGPLGFVGLFALSDRGVADAGAQPRMREGARLAWRMLFELCRFVLLWMLAMQLVEWFNSATAWAEAHRRSVSMAQVLAERDASSGMWAFGDSLRAGFVLILLYLLWPAGMAAIRWLGRRSRSAGS